MNRFISSALIFTLVSFACVWQPAAPAPAASPSGSVLFQDDFSKPTTGWDRLQAAEGIMDYDGGGYRMLVNSLKTNFWSTPRLNLSDVRIEVDSGKLAGPDENRIGLICRFNGTDYYFFLLSSDGYYGIGIYTGGLGVLLGQSEMQPSTNIHTGLAVNHLRADCIGNTLTFFVNGIQVAQAQDATLKQGDVGLLAGTFSTPGVDVVFDNFVVLQP
ncbi:MAG: hypothetical protein IT311_05035 [Anaerolineales bacterium]|nr:hypothetical protein [Anaerolineales bacterium]MCZ2122438.1 hypothetical protein [Anaerolineales bacterium]